MGWSTIIIFILSGLILLLLLIVFGLFSIIGIVYDCIPFIDKLHPKDKRIK